VTRARAFFLVLALSARASAAQSGDPAPGDEGWSFTLAPYYWAAGFDGDLTLDGQEIEGDGDSDGFPGELSLSGFLGHFEARKEPWAFALSPVFVDVAIDGDDTPPANTDLELSGAIVEGFATYALGSGWDVLAGVRYYSLEGVAEVTLAGVPQPDLDADTSWFDPIVGIRYATAFADDWSFHARTDVGGFGVGSNLAWNADAALGYRLATWASLFLGYRALDFDFADGSGSDRVEYDVRLWGPLVGVSFNL
jgi:hypothetical protein